MAAAAIGAIPQNIRFSIEENRMSQKLLCVIPIAGFVYSLFQQYSLFIQLEAERLAHNPQKAVFIARVLNDYHKTDIVRCIITVALIIFAISSAFISPQTYLAYLIICGSLGNFVRSICALVVNQFKIGIIEQHPLHLQVAIFM